MSRQELTEAVHDNLCNLGLDAINVVNLRLGGTEKPSEASLTEPLTVLAELKEQGLNPLTICVRTSKPQICNFHRKRSPTWTRSRQLLLGEEHKNPLLN